MRPTMRTRFVQKGWCDMPTLASVTPVGLTNADAPFIEEARGRGELYIHQPYELYSDQNQETWRMLYARMTPRWTRSEASAAIRKRPARGPVPINRSTTDRLLRSNI